MFTSPELLPIVFLFGIAVGSFLNVVILRTKHQQSFIAGRSHCPHCNAPLAWWEMIPVFSYLVQRGRCRHCQRRLSWQYLLVELLSGFGWVAVWQALGNSWAVVAALMTVSTMILIVVYDARWSVIPDGFTFSFGVAALLTAWLTGLSLTDIVFGALAGGAFFGAQFVLSGRRWVGSGDVLLGLALGILLGWRMLGLGLMLAYFAGALVAIVLLLTKRAGSQSSIAFGPYLMAGGFVAWLWGGQIIDWYFAHAIFR